MAFVNKFGQKISYECSELIAELKEDIAEFGNITVEVVTEKRAGVKIYKDYNFPDGTEETAFTLGENESMEQMKAVELLEIYEKQNSIF